MSPVSRGRIVMGVVVVLVSIKIVEIVRWCVLWLVVGVIVFLVLQVRRRREEGMGK